ncbi:hypothetical protein Trydic_g22491 [Trypoxylus dichotomus]
MARSRVGISINFWDRLNHIHQRIKFTMEIEEQNQFPLPGVLVKKEENGTLGYKVVYRKVTHTNKYLKVIKLGPHAKDEIKTIEESLLLNEY